MPRLRLPAKVSRSGMRSGWRKDKSKGAKAEGVGADQAAMGAINRPLRRVSLRAGLVKLGGLRSFVSLRMTRRVSLRAGLAVLGGRAAGAMSRRLHLGGGTSIVGLVAQRLHPGIVGRLASQLEHGSVMVTGTNGKTTTSGFIAAILADAGLRVWRNREGSNLMGGIASSLVIRALPSGNLRRGGRAISVLEVDEAVIPQVVRVVPPRVVVFTNLFRDQLDRYGEVDSVAARWQQAIKTLSSDTILVLNADDPITANLGDGFAGQVLYFGIDDPSLDLAMQQDAPERHQVIDTDRPFAALRVTEHKQGVPERHQVIDTRSCPRCGGDYTYEIRFFSHMGHYRCTNCGQQRPQPNVRAITVQSDDFDRVRIRIARSFASLRMTDVSPRMTDASPRMAAQQQEMVIPLPGLYNIYNALAAATVAQALGIGWEPIVTGIEQFKPIFGRGERLQIEGRTLRLLLAKNPTGLNEVLRTLFGEGTQRHVLFVLNDNIADGRDISWIWDVDFERAVGQTRTLVVAGSRALDLALRLKYAGVAQQNMTTVTTAPLRATKRRLTLHNRNKRAIKNRTMVVTEETLEQASSITLPRHYGIAEALDVAVQLTPAGETLFVVPTYTGLLEIQRELERRGLTPHYWEGRDR